MAYYAVDRLIDQSDLGMDKTTHSTGCGLVFTKIPRASIVKMTVEGNEMSFPHSQSVCRVASADRLARR